jgi:hypothetical protein
MAVGRNVQTGNVQTDGEDMSKEHFELIKQSISKELTEDEKLKLLEWLLKDSVLNNRHAILGGGNFIKVNNVFQIQGGSESRELIRAIASVLEKEKPFGGEFTVE